MHLCVGMSMGPSVDLFTLAHLLSLCLASFAARRSAFGRAGGLGGLSHQWEGGERHLAGGSCPTIWDSYPLGDPQWWQSRAAGAGSLLGSLPPRRGLRSLQSVHCCRLLLLKIFFNVLKKKDYFVTIIQQRVSVPVENINRLL